MNFVIYFLMAANIFGRPRHQVRSRVTFLTWVHRRLAIVRCKWVWAGRLKICSWCHVVENNNRKRRKTKLTNRGRIRKIRVKVNDFCHNNAPQKYDNEFSSSGPWSFPLLVMEISTWPTQSGCPTKKSNRHWSFLFEALLGIAAIFHLFLLGWRTRELSLLQLACLHLHSKHKTWKKSKQKFTSSSSEYIKQQRQSTVVVKTTFLYIDRSFVADVSRADNNNKKEKKKPISGKK